MFLIEADGKRIWHTGDYREHGYLGKGLEKVLRAYAKDIDVLITEGTNLKKPEKCIHESEVSSRMSHVMRAFKYVFVLASSTDIDRLATIKKAARSARKKLYINSAYMKETMRIFTEREANVSNGLYKFHPRFATESSLDEMKRDGFVLVTGVRKVKEVEGMRMNLPDSDTILIYSSWDGYYKIPEQVKVNDGYQKFRKLFNNVVDIHTSGHADRDTIRKVIDIVNPKEDVIVIHREADASLELLGI
jgi:ribonuclease J